jgi:hypothetical protein
MRKPIHITTLPPTLEEMEKRFRIPKARKKELQELVEEFKSTHLVRDMAPPNLIDSEKRRKRASAA